MSDKPSYLGLLNTIAVAETQAHAYYSAWADVTPSDDVRAVLRTIAIREGEHGMAFTKRMSELGYQVRPHGEEDAAERMAVASSDCSDLEKMEWFGVGAGPVDETTAFLSNLFADTTIDIRTGELLGRYIAEERDSARLARSCYDLLKAAAPAEAPGGTDGLAAKVDALTDVVTELCGLVTTQLAAGTGNGGSPGGGKKVGRAHA